MREKRGPCEPFVARTTVVEASWREGASWLARIRSRLLVGIATGNLGSLLVGCSFPPHSSAVAIPHLGLLGFSLESGLLLALVESFGVNDSVEESGNHLDRCCELSQVNARVALSTGTLSL